MLLHPCTIATSLQVQAMESPLPKGDWNVFKYVIETIFQYCGSQKLYGMYKIELLIRFARARIIPAPVPLGLAPRNHKLSSLVDSSYLCLFILIFEN